MYFCGPTVYQRIHIGNARPFVLVMWLRAGSRNSGYTVKLAENVTDINDKIYDAARPLGIGSAELARRATGWYVEDTDGLGLGRPDVEPLATETVGEIVAPHRGSDRARARLRVERRRVLPRRALPRVRPRCRARASTTWCAGARRLKEDPRDFALWKATKPDEDTCVGFALGPRPARAGTSSARRWPRSTSARASRSTAAGSTCASRTTRTSSRSPAAPAAVRAHLDAQRHARARRREDVEVDRQHRVAPRGARPMGPRGHPRLLPRRPLPRARSSSPRSPCSRRGAGGRLPQGVPRRRRRGERPRLGRALRPRSTTTSTRRARSPSSTAGVRPASSTSSPAASPSSGSRSIRRRRRAARDVTARVDRAGGAGRRDFAEADRLRAEIERLGWEVQDVADGFRLIPSSAERPSI